MQKRQSHGALSVRLVVARVITLVPIQAHCEPRLGVFPGKTRHSFCSFSIFSPSAPVKYTYIVIQSHPQS